MNSRDNDSSTTQRRTIRPPRGLDLRGGTDACLVVLQGQRLGQRIDIGAPERRIIASGNVVGHDPRCLSRFPALPKRR